MVFIGKRSQLVPERLISTTSHRMLLVKKTQLYKMLLHTFLPYMQRCVGTHTHNEVKKQAMKILHTHTHTHTSFIKSPLNTCSACPILHTHISMKNEMSVKPSLVPNIQTHKPLMRAPSPLNCHYIYSFRLI